MKHGNLSLDRNELHAYLWSQADGANRLRLDQTILAEELGVHRVTIARIMADFLTEGRVTKIKSGYRRVVLYQIIDPAIWKKIDD